MTQCPVRAIPAGPLRIKDLADPFGRRQKVHVTVHSHIVVDGKQLAAAVRQIRDKRRNSDGPSDGAQ